MNCIVLTPDGFKEGIQGSYDAAAWASAEAAGLVCLPAACIRGGSDIRAIGVGFYWSSSANDSDAARGVSFNNTVELGFSGNRNGGCSVGPSGKLCVSASLQNISESREQNRN